MSLPKPLSSEPSPTGPLYPALQRLPPSRVLPLPITTATYSPLGTANTMCVEGSFLPKSLQAPLSPQENMGLALLLLDPHLLVKMEAPTTAPKR